MWDADAPSSALLVLRAWREDGALRVRVASTAQVRDGSLVERVVATPDAVVDAVRAWLDTVPD